VWLTMRLPLIDSGIFWIVLTFLAILVKSQLAEIEHNRTVVMELEPLKAAEHRGRNSADSFCYAVTASDLSPGLWCVATCSLKACLAVARCSEASRTSGSSSINTLLNCGHLLLSGEPDVSFDRFSVVFQ
jgi:hypothetical protein